MQSTDALLILKHIKARVASRPDFPERYQLARKIIRCFSKSSFYEVSTRCNLFCEGCYYYESDGFDPTLEEGADQEWVDFFKAEAARGVTMGYFVGAEPALEQKRLVAASGLIPHGNIGTNGTKRITDEVNFRIEISMWGDEATDTKLRGAPVIRKALRNYEDDPRAIVLATLSRWNIDQIPDIAALCSDHNIPVTFNIFSPTTSYLRKIRADQEHDKKFFRLADSSDSPMFRDEDLPYLRDAVDRAIDDFPDTVIFSKSYNKWMTKPGPLYELDENGVAQNCSSRILAPLTYHKANRVQTPVKCCTSDVDCSQCRMYSGGWSSRLSPKLADVATDEAFDDWLGVMDTLGQIFLLPETYTKFHATSFKRKEPTIDDRKPSGQLHAVG
ncbi:hypothetical protein ACTL6U_17005 [Rhodovibrionaceae bacterium A322]